MHKNLYNKSNVVVRKKKSITFKGYTTKEESLKIVNYPNQEVR